MSIKRFASLCCLLACLTGLLPVGRALAGNADDAKTNNESSPVTEDNTVGVLEQYIDGIVAACESAAGADSPQEWLDGGLSSEAGKSAEWYVLALAQYEGSLAFDRYVSALLDYLARSDAATAATKQRYALTLMATGHSDAPYVQETMEHSIGEQGIMSWVFGLHLMNNGAQSKAFSPETVVAELLSMQLADGGWALRGEAGDVDVTAMTLQALAPYYADKQAVRDAADAAITFLSDKQLVSGDFESFGTQNVESAAQVLIALTAIGIDPLHDSRFIKQGNSLLDGMLQYRLADDTFCHTMGGEGSSIATVQTLCALVALWRYEVQRSPLFVFDPAAVPTLGELPVIKRTDAAPQVAPEQVVSEKVHSENGLPVPQGYRLWAILGILVVMLAAVLTLYLKGKRHPKNYIFVGAVGAAAIALACSLNIQSADKYYTSVPQKPDAVGTVTMSIRCDTVAGKDNGSHIPKDGVILPPTVFEIASGETAYDILIEAARSFRISVDSTATGSGAKTMAYVSGIGNLYEFDFGGLSGWVYSVNGRMPSVSCGEYVLSDGDKIEWMYTCDLGNDVVPSN